MIKLHTIFFSHYLLCIMCIITYQNHKLFANWIYRTSLLIIIFEFTKLRLIVLFQLKKRNLQHTINDTVAQEFHCVYIRVIFTATKHETTHLIQTALFHVYET